MRPLRIDIIRHRHEKIREPVPSEEERVRQQAIVRGPLDHHRDAQDQGEGLRQARAHQARSGGRRERVVLVGLQPIRFLFEQKRAQKVTTEKLSRKSGVSRRAIEQWKRTANASVHNLVAVLDVMGCELVARRKET